MTSPLRPLKMALVMLVGFAAIGWLLAGLLLVKLHRTPATDHRMCSMVAFLRPASISNQMNLDRSSNEASNTTQSR